MADYKAVKVELTQNFNAEFSCRICLQEKSDLYLIFDQIYAKEGATVAQILTECTRYRVERHDELPHQICGVCMELAHQAYNFKIQTERAYRKLIGILAKDIDPIKTDADNENSNEKCTQTEKSAIHPCVICGEKFFDIFDLREHRQEQHRNSPIDCRICGKAFIHVRQLKSHLALEHPGEGLTFDIQCTICQRQFTRKDHMKRHVRNVHKQNLKLNSTKKENTRAVDDKSLAVNNSFTHWIDCNENESEMEDSGFTANGANSTCLEVVTNPITSDDDEHTSLADFKTTFCNLGIEPELHIKVENSEDFKLETSKPSSILSAQQAISKFKEESDFDDCKEGDDADNNADIDMVVNDNDVDDDDTDDGNAKEKTSNKIATVSKIPKTVSQDTNTIEQIDQNSSTIKKVKRVKIVREYLEKSKSASRQPYRKNKVNVEVRENNRCEVCQHTFSRHCHLRRHMLTHLNERPHACIYCSKSFTRSDHLKNHINNVHNLKQFKCEQCNCEFSRNDALMRHKEIKHGVDPNAHKIYDCEYCSKKFTSKTYLRKHKLLHTDRIFACKSCEETFKDRKQFREHERTHYAERRNFLCALCGESFVRNDYLVVHMRRHTGEKPYKCQFCEKSFPRATDVKMHERYHTNIKPNICDLCGKGFHRAYNLTIHMRTHTGERPYKCDQCTKSFAQSNDLKAHIRRHTGERYRCSECDASFLQLYGLRQHALSAHGIKIESNTGRLQKFPPLNTTGQQLQQQQQAFENTIALATKAAAVAAASATAIMTQEHMQNLQQSEEQHLPLAEHTTLHIPQTHNAAMQIPLE